MTITKIKNYVRTLYQFLLDSEHGVIVGPTVQPDKSHGDDLPDEHEHSLNNLHNPLYPTVDGKPPKIPQQEKPFKKPIKSDPNTYNPFGHQQPNQSEQQNHHSNKFDFVNYDDEISHHSNSAQNPGPGFFNPSASKNQYADYDSYGGGTGHLPPPPPPPSQKPNLQYHPYQNPDQVHSHDKLPPELFNILGPNSQNLQPHIRIEQLLQHIQGADQSGNIHLPSFVQQQQNGVNYPFIDHNPAGSQPDHLPNGPIAVGQRPTGGHFISNSLHAFI